MFIPLPGEMIYFDEHIFEMDVGSSEKIQSFQAMKLFLAPPGHREDLQGAWTGWTTT